MEFSGKEGERVAGMFLQGAKYMGNVDGHGADFMVKRTNSRGEKKVRHIEVKSTLSSDPEEKKNPKIILKMSQNGDHWEWTNKLADHVMFVTSSHVYFGNAEDVRNYVKKHYIKLEKVPEPIEKGVMQIYVPIRELVANDIIEGVERGKYDIAKKVFKFPKTKKIYPAPDNSVLKKATIAKNQYIQPQKFNRRMQIGNKR
ncbi:MAG: hypothetical protein V1977_01280 [Candidatus Diapherotrites archaeon]